MLRNRLVALGFLSIFGTVASGEYVTIEVTPIAGSCDQLGDARPIDSAIMFQGAITTREFVFDDGFEE